jgi:hypothetical protein
MSAANTIAAAVVATASENPADLEAHYGSRRLNVALDHILDDMLGGAHSQKLDDVRDQLDAEENEDAERFDGLS